MKNKVKKSPFKNDPLGIKYKLFKIKVKKAIYDTIRIRIKKLNLCLKTIEKIGCPKNETETAWLKKVIDEYDKTILDIDSENLRYARMFLEEK